EHFQQRVNRLVDFNRDRFHGESERIKESCQCALMLFSYSHMRFIETRLNAPSVTLGFMKKKAPVQLKFNERLAALRKERSLTQQALAEMVGMHISQIRRYEAGQSQPTLNVIRKRAVSLSVGAD